MTNSLGSWPMDWPQALGLGVLCVILGFSAALAWTALLARSKRKEEDSADD